MLSALAFAALLMVFGAVLPWTYRAHVGEYGTRLRFKARKGGALPGTGNIGWTVPPILSFEVTKNGVPSPTTISANFYIVSLGTCEYDWEPTTSSTLDASGTWELTLVVVHGTEHYRCDPVQLKVGPSLGGAPGSVASAYGTASQISAQIAALAATATAAAPAEIVFPRGTLTLDDMIDWASHVHLLAEGPVRITRSDAPAVGLADDPTNAILSAAGTLGATATTLTNDAAEGDTSLVVASTAGFTAGDWVLIATNTVNGTDAIAESGPGAGSDGFPNLPLYHLGQVEAVTDATHLALVQPVQGYFSALDDATFDPATVTTITPVEDVKISGPFFFDCAGGSIANAMLFRACVGVEVNGVRARGFSRAVVNIDRGTREWLVEDYTRVGENNCDILHESARNGAIRKFRCVTGGAKSHANGVPRHAISSRLRSCEIAMSDLQIHGAQGGISNWGDWHWSLTDWAVWDCDPTDRQARATAVELHLGGRLGVGLDMGTTSTINGYTAFGFDGHVSHGRVWDVACPGDAYSIYFHDCGDFTAHDVTVINHGRSPDAAGARRMRGVVVSDINGHSLIDGLQIAGCDGYQLTFENAGMTGGGIMRNIRLSAVAGTTPSPAGEGIFFNTSAAVVNFLLIDGLYFANFTIEWAFGSSFANGGLRLRNVIGNGHWTPTEELMPVFNLGLATFNPFALAEIGDGPVSGDLQVAVVASTGVGTAKNVVIHSPTSGTVAAAVLLASVCARGKSNTVRVSRDTAIVTGDKLRAGAGGNAVVDNAAAADEVIGVAMQHFTLSAGQTTLCSVM